MSSLTRSLAPEGGPQPSQKSPAADGISAMLASYQQTVRLLLNQDDCPGASVEELELFKRQFRNSAYTCRLGSCPRASLGFPSEQLRLEHERAHMRLRCTFSGCQYPSFISAQALRRHVNKYHNYAPARKSIRKVGHIPTGQDSVARPPREHATKPAPLNELKVDPSTPVGEIALLNFTRILLPLEQYNV